MIVHDTSMEIPIFNSLYNSNRHIRSKTFKILNNLEFKNVDSNDLVVKLLKKLPEINSLFETVLVSVNDKLVKLFLNNRIKFTDISKKMNSILNLKGFKKYKKLKANKIEDIINLNKKIEIKMNKKIN